MFEHSSTSLICDFSPVLIFFGFFNRFFIAPTGLFGRSHQNKAHPVWNCSSTSLSSAPSLVWMWVMRASGGCFIRPACVRSGVPGGSWYVIRPSCLVQPLHGSIAAPVTTSWPLRCVTLKEVEQESNPSGAKMMDGVCCAVLTDGPDGLRFTVLPHEIKLGRSDQCLF